MSRAANPQISFADWELMGQRLLLEPVLEAIADFLDDREEMIETIRVDLRRGLKNADTGRNGLTAQQVLRSLILMRVKNWDYRETSANGSPTDTRCAPSRNSTASRCPSTMRSSGRSCG